MNYWLLLYPLAAAFGYAVSALLVKRALEEGAGVMRMGFCSNVTMAILFLPLLLWAERPIIGDNQWWEPVLTSLFFFLGQIFTFLALRKGDVSVATPLMGSKVVFVAAFSVFLLPEPVPLAWWLAAGLTVWSLWLLRQGRPADKSRLILSIVYALLSALAFAVCDVLMERFGGEWGFQRFVPLVFGLVGFFSLFFIPFFRDPLTTIPARAWPWVAAGSVLLAGQAMAMAYALSTMGSATAVNVVYSLRGILSIILVVLVGAWFRNTENEVGRETMRRRFFSGILIFGAVLLVLLG